MEEDREATNLGPEVAEDIPSASTITPTPLKQPRKRFVGRKTAENGNGSLSTPIQADTDSNAPTSTALSARKPARAGPRVLNQVPASILEDPEINAAIHHLPGNYSFEIHKTIHRIRSLGAKNVALQFPEGLLMFAPLISDILTRFSPGTETLIMGDVTYGACCIDDYTARALGCDLLVHYGHSCLIPVDTTKGIKVLYVFVTIGIDTEHLLATVSRNFQSGKRMAIVGTIQFNATLHAILPRLREMGYDPFLPRSAPLSAGEILGCTAPTLFSKSSAPLPTPSSSAAASVSTAVPPSLPQQEADLILYVGDGRFHLESILISSPSLRSHTYRYDPYTRRLTHESYTHEEMHSLRHHAISTARKSLTSPALLAAPGPRTWGIILGTLGRQGNSHTLDLITTHLRAREIPVVTLLLSEIQPHKLALMTPDVAVWVQIACPRLSIDWGYAFERPLLSPYEALVALNVRDGRAWETAEGEQETEIDVQAKEQKSDAAVGVYPMDFYAKEGLGRTKSTDVDSASASLVMAPGDMISNVQSAEVVVP